MTETERMESLIAALTRRVQLLEQHQSNELPASRIIRAAAQAIGVRPSEIIGPSQRPRVSKARKLAIHLFRDQGFSLSETGRELGDRDTATIVYHLRKRAPAELAEALKVVRESQQD